MRYTREARCKNENKIFFIAVLKEDWFLKTSEIAQYLIRFILFIKINDDAHVQWNMRQIKEIIFQDNKQLHSSPLIVKYGSSFETHVLGHVFFITFTT